MGAFRHGDTGAPAINGRDFDFPAKGRADHGDWRAAIEIGSVAFENIVLLDIHEDVEVSLWAALCAGLTLAGKADAHAGLDARHREFAVFLNLASTATGFARFGDDLPFSAAAATGPLHREEPLLRPDASGAVTGWTGFRARAGFCAAAITGAAIDHGWHIDFSFFAVEGLFQRDV